MVALASLVPPTASSPDRFPAVPTSATALGASPSQKFALRGLCLIPVLESVTGLVTMINTSFIYDIICQIGLFSWIYIYILLLF